MYIKKHLIAIENTHPYFRYEMKIRENESLINPWIFTHGGVSANYVYLDELNAFLDFIGENKMLDIISEIPKI